MTASPTLRALAGRLGRSGMAGLALLLGAALAYPAFVAEPIARREALLARPADTSVTTSKAAPDAGEVEARLQDFQHSLPAGAAVPQWLGRIRNAAVQSGLTLRSADYKLERTADSAILRYRITLPLSGSYAQVRSFVATVLSEVPALSVDDVQLKREGTSPRTLDARIRLTLFIAQAER